MLRIDVVTLFPEMFTGPFAYSIVARAQEAGLVELHFHQLRNWAHDRHKTVDDYAYGGGKGMVLKPEPLFAAVESLRRPDSRVILLDPAGRCFDQQLAEDLSRCQSLILICGHYEGVDERVRQHLVDMEISIGDAILTGGEIPAMVVIDAVARLVPGVLAEGSAESESFSGLAPEYTSERLLEYPHYTRPARFHDWEVPAILLSGDHRGIAQWRREQARQRTRERRPDLLGTGE